MISFLLLTATLCGTVVLTGISNKFLVLFIYFINKISVFVGRYLLLFTFIGYEITPIAYCTLAWERIFS